MTVTRFGSGDPQMTQIDADVDAFHRRHLRIKAGDLELKDVEDNLADIEQIFPNLEDACPES